MQIPIIVSRKKSNGDLQHININLPKISTFDKTFNPYAIQQLNSFNHSQDEQQKNITNRKTLINLQKLSNGKPRRISSSSVSKRFPKDFFKQEQLLQPKICFKKSQFQSDGSHNILKRKHSRKKQSQISIKQVQNPIETPKFNSKTQQNNQSKKQQDQKSPINLKEYMKKGFLSYQKQDSFLNYAIISDKKIKMFKIKNNSSKTFVKKFQIQEATNNQIILQEDPTKNNIPTQKINKENLGNQIIKSRINSKKKVVCINGKKIGLEKDQNGCYRVKVFHHC